MNNEEKEKRIAFLTDEIEALEKWLADQPYYGYISPEMEYPAEMSTLFYARKERAELNGENWDFDEENQEGDSNEVS